MLLLPECSVISNFIHASILLHCSTALNLYLCRQGNISLPIHTQEKSQLSSLSFQTVLNVNWNIQVKFPFSIREALR